LEHEYLAPNYNSLLEADEDFVDKKLLPVLDQAEKRKLADAEKQWPEYPLMIKEAVHEASVDAPLAHSAGTRPLEVGLYRNIRTNRGGRRSRRRRTRNPVSLSAMYPHRIRLRGPWECDCLVSPLSQGAAPGFVPSHPPLSPEYRGREKETRRVTMPSRWLDAGLGDFRGTAASRASSAIQATSIAPNTFGSPATAARVALRCVLNGQVLSGQTGPMFH